MEKPYNIYLGLGSNLGDREKNLRRALQLLGERVGEPVKCSAFHATAPVGFHSENEFLNAAAAFRTRLSPLEVLRVSQEIERELGRTEKSRDGVYQDRIIDIDLLFADAFPHGYCEGNLLLPHPHAAERLFVLRPLCEVNPFLYFEKQKKYAFELLGDLEGPCIEETDYEPTSELLNGLNSLLSQLSSSVAPLTAESLQQLKENPCTHLYLLRNEVGTICGMLTLCLCTSPTGMKAWVEDVCVSAEERGKGFGRALMQRAKYYAQLYGAQHLNLTSRPERAAANRLYQSLSYEQRDTNVYRLKW